MDITVREYFNRPRAITRQIKRLSYEREELISCLLPSGIRYDVDRVQTSPEDMMPKVMARVDEIDRKIADLSMEKAAALIRIGKMLETLSNDFTRDVISLRFVKGLSPVKTASTLYCSEQAVYKHQRIGLRLLATKMYSEI